MELLTLLTVIAGVIITILWIALPFAVFGIKNTLKELLVVNKQLLVAHRAKD